MSTTCALPRRKASIQVTFAYLRGAFELLYAEGKTAPKMMSVGLHARLADRPGRAGALARFLDHVAGRPDVRISREIDIARHWIERHPLLAPIEP